MKIVGKWNEIEDESEDREGEVSADDDDDDCPPTIYFVPLVWRGEIIELEYLKYGTDEDPESEEMETETQVAVGKTTTMENDVENATETRIYEAGEFGNIEDWEREEINQDSKTHMHRRICEFPPIDRNEMERMKCRLMNRIKEIAEARTVEMYRSLLNVPEKTKALPADFMEKVRFIMAKKKADPSFQISSYYPDMMEFTFDPCPWFIPYNHLHVIRDKENGKRVYAGVFFDAFLRKEYGGHDEEKDEQFFQLYERLEDYMKTMFPKADLWKTEDRRTIRKAMVNHVKKERDFAWPRLPLSDIIYCAEIVILAAEKKELVEEYYRSNNNLWELLHEKKLNYSHPKVKAEFRKLKSMRLGLSPPIGIQDNSWRSVFDESDKEKWMKHIDAEREEIDQCIEERFGMAEHFKLKKKFAIEIGVWKASFEQIYKKKMWRW